MKNLHKIAFVTHYCTHYRIKTYEILAKQIDTDYYFYSMGDEWYWQRQHGVNDGEFHGEYLPGYRVAGTRITPTLGWKLWDEAYDAYIKCINGRFALPLTYLVARLRGKPFILWTGIWMRLQSPFHRLFYPITQYFYRNADAIVVYGDHVRRFLMEEGVDPKRIFVTTHAVDNEQYNRTVPNNETMHLRKKLGTGEDNPIVLYLGRLEEGKGLHYLVKAFAKVQSNSPILVLAGTGSQEAELKQLARDLGIDHRIRFPGYVRSEEAITYYAIATVYVLPSVTTRSFKEPWGLVVNEAFNQGVPVVATDAVGAAAGGLVQDQVNGFIVRERDSNALAGAIQKILSNPTLRSQFSTAAQDSVAPYNNENMVLGFVRAIEYAVRLT